MDTGTKSVIDRIYIFSFIAVLVLLPWSVVASNYALILMVVSGVWSTSWSEKITRAFQYKVAFIFILLFGLYVVGLFYSNNPDQGLKSIEQKLALLIIPILTVSSIPFSREQQNLAKLSFVYSVVLLTIVCVLSNVFVLTGGEPYPQVNFDIHTLARFNELHPDANPIWMQVSYIAFGKPMIASTTLFSLYLCISILILFHYETTSRKKLFLKYAVIAWFSLVVILLASRIGIFILFCVGTFNLIQQAFEKGFVLRYTLVSLLALILLSSFIVLSPITRFRVIEEPLSTPLRLPDDPTQWNSFNLRFLEWKSGVEGIKEHGMLGTGTGGTIDALQTYYNQVDLGDFDNNYSSNNQFLEAYLEIGIAGFGTLLLCFALPFVSAWKKRDMLLMSLVIMTCLACLSNSMFERARGLTFYVSFVSLFMFTKNKYVSEAAK